MQLLLSELCSWLKKPLLPRMWDGRDIIGGIQINWDDGTSSSLGTKTSDPDSIRIQLYSDPVIFGSKYIRIQVYSAQVYSDPGIFPRLTKLQ